MKSARVKLTRVMGQLSLLTLAMMVSNHAMADDAGWYIGANVGQSNAKIDNARIASELLGNGYSTTSISNDDYDTAYKIYGGYQFNRNFALEGGYFDLGKFGFDARTVPAGNLMGNIRLKGLNLDLVGTLPITNKFSVFGRIGVNHTQAQDTFSAAGAVRVLNSEPSQRDTNLKLGLGLQYAFTDALSLRAELERYRISDAVGNQGDIDLVSVGLVYRFGAKTQTPIYQAAAPAPVYVAPAPQPAVIAVAPPPPPPLPVPAPAPPTKVTFSADSLYDFDKTDLKPAGQQALDKFAADLKGANYERISVTGHSDRIGSHTYNLKLSERRAETVKDYLVQSAGIEADRVVAKGVDGADPVTQPGQCEGKKVSKALIACLQPDRRVEVEVTGTRAR